MVFYHKGLRVCKTPLPFVACARKAAIPHAQIWSAHESDVVGLRVRYPRGGLQGGRGSPRHSPTACGDRVQVAGGKIPSALPPSADTCDWLRCNSLCPSRPRSRRLRQKAADVLRSSGGRQLCLPSGLMYTHRRGGNSLQSDRAERHAQTVTPWRPCPC